MSKKHQLNLELTDAVKTRLDRISDAIEAASYAEVIRKALTLLECVIDGKVKMMCGDSKKQ